MPKALYNPLLVDIEVDFDKYGPKPEHFVLKKGDVAIFPEYVIPIIEEKLIDAILNKNPPANKNREKAKTEILSLIRVD